MPVSTDPRPFRAPAGRGLLLSVLAAATLAFAPGCKKKEQPAPEVKKEALAPEAAVPAPDGIVLEGVIRAPDTMLASLRVLSPLVPDKIGPLVADVMHVGKEVGTEVDGTKPCHLVMVRVGAETRFVLGVPVKDPGKVTAALAKLPFKPSEDKPLELSIYESTGTPKTQVVGVRRSFLLAASSVDALKALSPYVTRTMPGKPLPAEDVVVTIPQAAIRGALHESLSKIFEESAARRKELLLKAKAAAAPGTKGPPVGALDAIGDYSARQNARIVSWLKDAGDARVSLTTKDGAVALRAEMAAPAADSVFGKQVASWPLGDATLALGVPASALVAFVGRSSEAARAEASTDIAAMLAATFPDDVSEKDKAKVAGFLASWDKARGETTSGALMYEGPARLGVVLRLGAKDAPALSMLMKDALKSILSIKGVESGLVKEGIGAPTFTTEKLAGLDANVLTLKLPHKPGEKPKPGEPESAEVVWGPNGSEVSMAAGVGARDLLKALVEAKAATALEGAPALGAQVKALGGSLAGAALLLPGRIVPLASGAMVAMPAPPTDPVVIAIGKGASGPYVTVDLSRPALELSLRFLVGGMMGGGAVPKRPPVPAAPF